MTLPTIGWFCEHVGGDPTGLDPAEALGPLCIDSRRLSPGDTFCALDAVRDGHDFVEHAFAQGAKAAVVKRNWATSPSASRFRDRLLVVTDTRTALREAACAWRSSLSGTVIGITGSNGKTSTKDLIYLLLSLQFRTTATKGNLNNEIGVPLTLLSVPTDTEFAVIEMGASHPHEIAELCAICQPTHGLVTSIGSAHLEGFGSLDVIAQTKGQLYDFVAAHGIAFVPTEDERCVAEAAENKQRIGYGFAPPPACWNSPFKRAEQLTFDARGCPSFRFENVDIQINAPGRPAALAALAALTVATTLGVPATRCAAKLAEWTGVPGRSRLLTLRNLLVLDDSYNANPVSMLAALETLARLQGLRRVAILGDMHELGDTAPDAHRTLARSLQAHRVSVGLFVGRFADLCAEEARRTGVDAYPFADADHLQEQLPSLVRQGDAILVKGSRSVGLERVVDHLQQVFG